MPRQRRLSSLGLTNNGRAARKGYATHVSLYDNLTNNLESGQIYIKRESSDTSSPELGCQDVIHPTRETGKTALLTIGPDWFTQRLIPHTIFLAETSCRTAASDQLSSCHNGEVSFVARRIPVDVEMKLPPSKQDKPNHNTHTRLILQRRYTPLYSVWDVTQFKTGGGWGNCRAAKKAARGLNWGAGTRGRLAVQIVCQLATPRIDKDNCLPTFRQDGDTSCVDRPSTRA
ncbi:hypothetical protein BDV93DRAFT_508662 [Ceratobasidium sp. AG-I]|nr:hypothetical protein BDV93DRAFT_508662 [Ceratobasidium sp. AG-I]